MTILFVFLCSGLFASSLIIVDSRSFKLTHTVSEDSRFVFTFMNTNVQNPTELNSVEFQSAGTYRFARFQISISTPRPITFTSIELAFSELEHNTVDDAYYDYSLQVYEPFTETATGEVTPVQDGHGACSVEFVTSQSGLTFSNTSGSTLDIEIADLEITLDDSDSRPGTYSGTVTCTFTVMDSV